MEECFIVITVKMENRKCVVCGTEKFVAKKSVQLCGEDKMIMK